MYCTEPHLHTAETSSCGKLPAAAIIRLCYNAGYTTVFVTDHYYKAFFDRHSDMGFSEQIDLFFAGYRAAKAEGDRLGMTVLPGAEIMLDCCPNHYLLYGMDTDFLKSHPDLLSLTPEGLGDFARSHGMLLIQAHPYRGKCYPTPDAVDGFEVRNTNPRHFVAEDEPRAVACAEEHSLLMTGGSDAHRTEDIPGSGIATETRILSSADYAAALRGGVYTILGQSPDL